MDRNTIIALAVIAALGLAGIGGWYLVGFQKNPAGPPEPVTVAYSPFESTALLWVAEDQHFFVQNGLNLTLKKYDSGAGSLDGVINGEADMAVGVTEFPLVRKAFQNEKVRALGNIDKGEFTYLVARKDRGIAKVTDLRGKRVGTTRGSIAEFYLGRYLALNGMTMRDITLVDVRTPAGWVNDVADGKLDAISTAEPYASAARDRLGDNAVMWSVQSRQPLFALVVSTDEWREQHPGPARRFLLSLEQAEEYTNAHPAEARAIVQKRLNLSESYMPAVWQQNQFGLSLDQSLITAMEDEARWMIANNMTNATAVPDFRKYVSTDGLETVKPGSVNIIQ
jgi:NitT/TauT family transport system substrate-binding protein